MLTVTHGIQYFKSVCSFPLFASSEKERNNWIPLTTYSRNELKRLTPLQRYHQLISMLSHHGLFSQDRQISNKLLLEPIIFTPEQIEKLVSILREDTICRRLANLVMNPTMQDALIKHEKQLNLLQEMASIWPRLLELPSKDVNKNSFELSVVIPSHRESGEMLETHISLLQDRCVNPEKIEIIVVDAGGGTKENELLNAIEKYNKTISCEISSTEHVPNNSRHFGSVRWLEFAKGGGRGACLNYGAAKAKGRILTFCHADTLLPPSWDEKIVATLDETDSTEKASACAFNFGVDLSVTELSNTSPKAICNRQLCCRPTSPGPPGIKVVEKFINIRSHCFSLPYGDQAISISKHIFDFLGGFPDQCLMEDYDFVSFLRNRASKLKTNSKEALKIIDGEPVLCSPRRWEKFGVLYVTYTNFKCVNQYRRGMEPDELYKLYYGRGPPERESELSPWEIEMELVLNKTTDLK